MFELLTEIAPGPEGGSPMLFNPDTAPGGEPIYFRDFERLLPDRPESGSRSQRAPEVKPKSKPSYLPWTRIGGGLVVMPDYFMVNYVI